MIKNFTKKDLQNGMMVETRNGNIYMIVGENLMRNEGYLPLSCINDDLTSTYGNGVLDIIKVYKAPITLDLEYEAQTSQVIWERTESCDIVIGDVFLNNDGGKLFIYNIEEYPNGATYYEAFEVFYICNELQFIDSEYTDEDMKNFTFVENKPIYVEALHALMEGLNNEQIQA